MLPAALLATAALGVHVQGWTVLRVNHSSAHVRPGATVPFCRSISTTVLTARLRPSVTGRSVRVRVSLRVPRHSAPRHRTVRVKRGTRVSFTPRGLHLRDEQFTEGTYRLTVRRGGRTLDRAVLHMRGGGNC